ncbi:hypothetical protein VKT23_020717 [Stygiomarasmius scandens]|uniref:Ubiquitin-like domain-containing protein n=1 Tax=Marasmiellus scandens TaxID=2682957 RepID=A0ABR1IIH0_9AGAR
MTIFITGLQGKSVPMCVRDNTTVTDILFDLRVRQLLPWSQAELLSSSYSIYRTGSFRRLKPHQTMRELGIQSLSHLSLRIHLLGGTPTSGSALNADGTLKDAEEIPFYHSAGDDSDSPMAGPSQMTGRGKRKIDKSRMQAILAAEQESDADPAPRKSVPRRRRQRKSHTAADFDDINDSDFSQNSGKNDDSTDSDPDFHITNEELAESLPTKTVPEGSQRPRPKKSSKQKSRRREPSVEEVTPHQRDTLNKRKHNMEDGADDSTSTLEMYIKATPRRKTSNPIYLFFEQVLLNAQGSPGAPGDKHYKCYHGKRKVLTVTKAMKSCVTGLTNHLKAHFPAMHRLWEILHRRSDPPTPEEKEIAAGHKALDTKAVNSYLAKLEKASQDIQQAFEQQAAKSAGPWDQAEFEKLLVEWIVACDQPFEEVE